MEDDEIVSGEEEIFYDYTVPSRTGAEGLDQIRTQPTSNSDCG